MLAFPIFSILSSQPSIPVAWLMTMFCGILVALILGAGPSALAELFPTRSGTSGLSIGYGLGAALGGGFAPYISLQLIDMTKSPTAPAIFVMAVAAIALVAVLSFRETAHEELAEG